MWQNTQNVYARTIMEKVSIFYGAGKVTQIDESY